MVNRNGRQSSSPSLTIGVLIVALLILAKIAVQAVENFFQGLSHPLEWYTGGVEFWLFIWFWVTIIVLAAVGSRK